MAKVRDVISREIELEKKGILADIELANMKKVAFINEIRSGLGEDIKKDLNKVKVIKENKFLKFIKKIFTKF